MPLVEMTIPEVTESVSRPIIFDIIKQVQEITKIDKNIKIIFPGDAGKMQQSGTAINEEDRQTLLTSGKFMHIEVDEDYDPQYLATTAVTRPEQIPVFYDPDIEAIIRPLYATTMVTIKFKYQTPSRTEAIRWRDDVRMRLSILRDINLHNITYHFVIPYQYMNLLKALYNNKQRLLKDSHSFEQYVNMNITPRAKLISDLVGNQQKLSISETQCRIVGIFGFDSMPEKPQRDDDTGAWTIDFSYKFTYEKPNMVSFRYPVIVFNKLLPKEYIGFWNKDYDLDNVKKSYSISIGALSNFDLTNDFNRYVDLKAEFNLPTFDDFIPNVKPPSSVGIFNALCEVDEIDLRTLLNLKELGDIILDADIIAFIQNSEAPYIGELYNSIFFIGLYSNASLSSSGSLVCLPDLTIQAATSLNLKNIYHIRFSIITNLNLINPAFFARLKKFPRAMCKLVIAINSAYRNSPELHTIYANNLITECDFSTLFSNIPALRSLTKNSTAGSTCNTTNTSSVSTSVSTIYSSSTTVNKTVNDNIACIRGAGLKALTNIGGLSMYTVMTSSIISLRKQ